MVKVKLYFALNSITFMNFYTDNTENGDHRKSVQKELSDENDSNDSRSENNIEPEVESQPVSPDEQIRKRLIRKYLMKPLNIIFDVLSSAFF